MRGNGAPTMADRTLVRYEEPRLDDGPHWSLEISRSAAGQPGLFFTIQHKSLDGTFEEEMTVIVDDGNVLLAPVLAWLDGSA